MCEQVHCIFTGCGHWTRCEPCILFFSHSISNPSTNPFSFTSKPMQNHFNTPLAPCLFYSKSSLTWLSELLLHACFCLYYLSSSLNWAASISPLESYVAHSSALQPQKIPLLPHRQVSQWSARPCTPNSPPLHHPFMTCWLSFQFYTQPKHKGLCSHCSCAGNALSPPAFALSLCSNVASLRLPHHPIPNTALAITATASFLSATPNIFFCLLFGLSPPPALCLLLFPTLMHTV